MTKNYLSNDFEKPPEESNHQDYENAPEHKLIDMKPFHPMMELLIQILRFRPLAVANFILTICTKALV